jgi:hypothetical protein
LKLADWKFKYCFVEDCIQTHASFMNVGGGVAGVGRVLWTPQAAESKGRQNVYFDEKNVIFFLCPQKF